VALVSGSVCTRDLPSFPTRRSSDLPGSRRRAGAGMDHGLRQPPDHLVDRPRHAQPAPACQRTHGPRPARRPPDLTGGRVNRASTPPRYPAQMLSPPRALPAILLLASLGTVHAASVSSVEIKGLDDEMEDNVRTSLSLVDAIGDDVTWRRLAYMLRAAGDETREALEPFGYYSPRIVAERVRDAQRQVVLD